MSPKLTPVAPDKAAHAFTIACPVCGVAPQAKCVTNMGKVVDRPHGMRVKNALRAKRILEESRARCAQ